MSARRGTNTTERVLAGRYRLGARRGAGLDIAIFEGFDDELQRKVSVRVLHPDICASEGFGERFRSTMQKVASLDHPNLAAVLDWGPAEWNGQPVQFVVSEHLTGGSLRDLLDRGRHLTPSQALAVGVDACRALDIAHRHDLVHGDVRPASIVFGEDQRLRLVDLGIARLAVETIWNDPSEMSLERARYVSPERADGRELDPKSDVYSLTLTLIEAVTGHVPFTSDSTVSTLAGRIGKLMPVTADLGPLASVLERAGRPETDTRYTAAEFGRALVQAAEKLPRPAPLPLLGSTPFGETRDSDPSGQVAGDTSVWAVAPPGEQPPADLADAPDDDAPSIAPTTRMATTPLSTTPTTTMSTSGEGVVASVPTAVLPTVPAPPADGDEPSLLSSRRSRRKLLGLVAVLLLAAGAGGLLAWYLNRDQSNLVPDLVGLDVGEALNEISAYDWDTSQVGEASDSVDEGEVIRTDPAAGVRLDPGDAFVLVVSSGPAPRVLPEITGTTVEQATAMLDTLGLVLQEGGREFDETVAAGTVMSWTIPAQPGLVAGGTALPGTVIVATVSAGPEPRVVPDLTGLALADATAQLGALGLVVSQLPDEFHATIAAGGVARQNPPAGSAIARDSTVEIAMSKGPDVVPLPSLGQLTLAEVTAALDQAGLTIGTVGGDPSGVAVLVEFEQTGIVSGTMLPRGAAVDVTFAVPPPSTTVAPTTTAPETTVPATDAPTTAPATTAPATSTV